jgi:uncharacterized protein (DUF2062 family)
MRRYYDRLKELWFGLKNEISVPRKAALGISIGVFIGITPTIPFHTLLAVVLARAFKASQIAAALGVWISNPLTIPPLYWGSFKAGYWLLGRTPPLHLPPGFGLTDLLRSGAEIAALTFLGGFVLALVPAIASYFISLTIFKTLSRREVHNQT